MDCLLKNACGRVDSEYCNENCTIYREFYYLLESSDIPKNYWEDKRLYPSEDDVKAFETLRAIKEDIETFVEEGRFLFLYGNYGNSKSTWAIKILKSFLAAKCIGNNFKDIARFIYIPTFTIASKNFEDKNALNELLNSVVTRKLVVVDDIGSIDRQSSYDNTILSNLVNERYSRGLATIFTSNIPPERLNHFIDPRLVDRICSDIVIEFKGGSRRESTSEYKRRE